MHAREPLADESMPLEEPACGDDFADRNLLALIERVQHVRTFGLDRSCQAAVPPAVFERLAHEGLRMTTQHLGELSPDRRYALLAATVIRLESQLIDATLAMFEKLMGSLARMVGGSRG